MKTRKEFLQKILMGMASLSIPALLFKLFGQAGKSDKENSEQEKI